MIKLKSVLTFCMHIFVANITEKKGKLSSAIIEFVKLLNLIYEGCPSKSWTFVITRDCVPVIL